MKIPTWNDDCQQVLITSAQEEQLPKNKAQTVRFAADVTVHSVISIEDYSESEAKACFYNKMDYKKFKRSSLVTLKLNREGELPSDHTMRGLECRTREGAAAKKETRRAVMQAAYEELTRQQAENIQDADALASALREVTSSEQHRAAVRGLCDELEVREYFQLAQALAVRKQQSTAPTVGSLVLQGILDQREITTMVGPAA